VNELEELSLDYLRTVMDAAKTLRSVDMQACFVAAMGNLEVAESDVAMLSRKCDDAATSTGILKSNFLSVNEAYTKLSDEYDQLRREQGDAALKLIELRRERDAALKANCQTTTTEQIDTVARQLSAELGVPVQIEYAIQCGCKPGNGLSNFKRLHVFVWQGCVAFEETKDTLPELAASVRKWWAERNRKSANSQ
jgi:hypothetical protein